MICGNSESEIDKFFFSTDWITNELMDQIFSYAHQLADITTDKISIPSIKSNEVFERNCSIIFPENRKFMSYRQLDQFVTLFLKS